ncbi:hypothetical protein ABZ027_12960 [Streptomyces sp. NPDC006332]|uniref:hypothetical protein n=1 Tax=Streptomyces sp. NPDC006332 TaxID=3155456 RepID=UPI0033B86879
MLALRLTRGAHPAVQFRRLLVAAAAGGTGFLLLCTLGYAMGHPDDPAGSLLRLAWCATPLATTVYLAVTVARTDPAARPRTGLSAIGLGPVRLMAVSATTTALSCALGSMLALLVFLHLRGDLTGMPFDRAAAEFLAAGAPLPLPGALTLLALVPVSASLAVGLTSRPREGRQAAALAGVRSFGRLGTYGTHAARATLGAYGRFGARAGARREPDSRRPQEAGDTGGRSAVATAPDTGTPNIGSAVTTTPDTATPDTDTADLSPDHSPGGSLASSPQVAPRGLPWGIAILAAGLAVEAYANRAAPAPAPTSSLTMPGGLSTAGPAGVLVGWVLTALGLALAGPGLTHLCGRLLQTARPGALRLLAGRVLMAEATRIGRPLGVVCAVLSGTYAMTALYDTADPSVGPLTVLGLILVTGCTVATLATAAVEAKQARADTTAALLRLGAPSTTLRSAAALRAAALLALFGPLTLVVAELAALPLAR